MKLLPTPRSWPPARRVQRQTLTNRFPSRALWVALTAGLLALISPAGAQAPPAPQTTHSLPANDWRQLWSDEAWQTWDKRTEADLSKLADTGHPAAQYVLWWKWRRAKPAEAGALLNKAADAGLPQAEHALGTRLFESASEARQKRLQGWAMVESAAEKGFVPAAIWLAQYESGYVSTSGIEIKPNLPRALKGFREGTAIGNSESMVRLALLYSSGVGEPASDKDSPHALLVRAAELGNTGAMVHLSARFAAGHGEPVDTLEAARWRMLARA